MISSPPWQHAVTHKVYCRLASLLHEERGEVDAAKSMLQRALALRPGHAMALFQMGSVEEDAGCDSKVEQSRTERAV